ncbi:hypothetical protein BJP40_06605 [Streptomyces sp. CC53]|uniref:hypothetical protein n=1 Tax=Streptomyces sp. CC53 TaxID=1906740 RepID=UPI0008DCD1F3|nr:hypothetical protein [Streptomyces sp. CC53]OII61193.1 hypothetical protein BJP40_06605 [Streptomyces sp. CC53]
MLNLPTTSTYTGLATPAAPNSFPELFGYHQARPLIADALESAPLLGIDGEGEPVAIDLDSDSPHVLISAASGGGKSVILRSIAAQALAAGNKVAFLDVKRHSHRWAKNLPGADYASTLPEIGDALVALGMEVHRRNEIVDSFPGPVEEAPVGERIIVVFEEMNATMGQLQALGRKLPRDKYDAIDALGDIMFMGRAAKMHVVAVAQYATAAALGGGDIRENFSTRILIRYSDRAWKMLTDVWPPQPSPEEPGRGMVCRAGKARETQFLYLSEEEAATLVREAHRARNGADAAEPARRDRRQARQEAFRRTLEGRMALHRQGRL